MMKGLCNHDGIGKQQAQEWKQATRKEANKKRSLLAPLGIRVSRTRKTIFLRILSICVCFGKMDGRCNGCQNYRHLQEAHAEKNGHDDEKGEADIHHQLRYLGIELFF